MTWEEWSHTEDAEQNAYENLRNRTNDWLQVCYAEILTDQSIGHGGEEEWLEYYNEHALPFARYSMTREELIEHIWKFSKSQRSCDNGGWNAWMCCPYGCHTVSFDEPTPSLRCRG